MSSWHGDDETRFFRLRVLALLEEHGFIAVEEGVSRSEGWRGEFVGGRGGTVACLAHKPQDAPFVTLECLLPGPAPGSLADAEAVVDAASDHDVAVYWLPGRDGVVFHLSCRLLAGNLNRDEFGFMLRNLTFCRESVAAVLGTPA